MINTINLHAARKIVENLYGPMLANNDSITPKSFYFDANFMIEENIDQTLDILIGNLFVSLNPIDNSNSLNAELQTINGVTRTQFFKTNMMASQNFNINVIEFTKLEIFSQNDLNLKCYFAGYAFRLLNPIP